jgi:hypothetical protein
MRKTRRSDAGTITAASSNAEMTRVASSSVDSRQRRGVSRGTSVEASGPVGSEQGVARWQWRAGAWPGGGAGGRRHGTAGACGRRLDSPWWCPGGGAGWRCRQPVA